MGGTVLTIFGNTICSLSMVLKSVLAKPSGNQAAFFFSFLKFLFIYLEREEGREKERERNIDVWLPLTWPPTGDLAYNPGCALTGNWTGDPLVHSPSSIYWATPARASSFILNIYFIFVFFKKYFWLCLSVYMWDEENMLFFGIWFQVTKIGTTIPNNFFERLTQTKLELYRSSYKLPKKTIWFSKVGSGVFFVQLSVAWTSVMVWSMSSGAVV